MIPKTVGNIEEIPSFDQFRDLIIENIGYFPKFQYDKKGLSGHRMRVFRDPPAADIRYSERALVRYISLVDLILGAIERNKIEALTSGLCLLRGGELLRHNRFAGLGFIAKAFSSNIKFVQLGPQQVVENALKASSQCGSMTAIINLLLPLAHEIGHLPESQALCPRPIHSDAFHETYSINFEMVRRITGEFDYKSSLSNPESPLNLTVLREETASDFFAVASMTYLAMRCTPNGEEYPLIEVVSGILMFPLVMGLESIALKENASRREVQDIILAMQCRYSVMIDSVRACIKSQCRHKSNYVEIEHVIDSCINDLVAKFDKFHCSVWDAFYEYLRINEQFVSYSEAEILELVREIRAIPHKAIAMADYLEALAKDVHGYSINAENEANINGYSLSLKTFDTIILEGENVLFLR
jgi:hypothetical protein